MSEPLLRKTAVKRQTSETNVHIQLNVDGTGEHDISTCVGFLDHMLTAFAVHGMFDLTISATGDLHIDNHHTIEDVGIVLGQTLDKALGDRKGINRMGHAYVPMDEALGFVALDFSGRPFTLFNASWNTPAIGQMPTDMVQHFFETVAIHAKMTLHAKIEHGRNDHHKAEALFKALGRAMRIAVARDPQQTGVPSTKGTLTE